MKRRRTKNYMIYGIALVICLLFIGGLTDRLQGREHTGEQGDKTGKESGERGGEDGKKAEEDKKESQQASLENTDIRVLVLSTGYGNQTHPRAEVSADGGLRITVGDTVEEWKSQEPVIVAPDDQRFGKGSIRIEPLNQGEEISVRNIERGYGTPTYGGVLELRTTAEGIVIINELPLEEYLCKVVPSEMPASYELEALKAQAVCARSYASRQMAGYGYPEYEAHVNDSTDYQVYNNSEAQEQSSRAVSETAGQVVRFRGEVVTTYYYSTSCGKTTGVEAWGTTPSESNSYLQEVSVCGSEGDYERELPWYRWTAIVSVQRLSELVSLNTGVDVGTIQSLDIAKKGPGGVALQIVVTGDRNSVTVDTENKIRSALGGSGYTITKNDGTVIDSTRLLPSAFFTAERAGDEYVIRGGGFGHGIGMSQNGANEMAKEGKTYKDILGLFYPGVAVE